VLSGGRRNQLTMEIFGKAIRMRGKLARIAYLDGEGYEFLDSPEEALEALRGSGRRIDLFTFIQMLSEPSPKYTYPMEWDNFAALRISTFDDWMARLRPRMRTMVRKTERDGVLVREVPFDDALIRAIHAIYNETPIRQGRRFWHYGKDLEAVRKVSATFLDRSMFIGAFFQGNLIGFAKLVSDEDRTQAGLMHILSRIDQRDKAPTNALIAQAVRSCAERQIKYLWYANFAYGKREHDSLAEFKRRNAFEKVDVPRYYVPLTAVGRMALRLGLHHRLIDRIPAPVAVAYRSIRKSWYARRFAGLENA
jgi:hypothetical protein